MYSILHQVVEDLPQFRHGAASRVLPDTDFISVADPSTDRQDTAPAAVSLTEFKASGCGCHAFEVRWTSLAA